MRRTLRRNCVHHRVTNAVAIVVANVFGNFLTITDLRRSGQKVPNGLFTIFENAISNKNATIPPEDVMNIVVQQFRGAVHTRYQIPRFFAQCAQGARVELLYEPLWESMPQPASDVHLERAVRTTMQYRKIMFER